MERKRYKNLTIYQKMQAKKLATPQTTIKQLAQKIGASYQTTYRHVMRENLPCKMIESAIIRKNSRFGTRSGKFNVHAKQWF